MEVNIPSPSELSLLIVVHFVVEPAFTLHTSTVGVREVPYFEYVTDRLTWHSAGRLCSLRMGALATASDAAENQALTAFLKSRNISQPVWVASTFMTHVKGELIQVPLT